MQNGKSMYVHGRKCWFCGKYGLFRLADKRIKCKNCRKKYSIKKLKIDAVSKRYAFISKSNHPIFRK